MSQPQRLPVEQLIQQCAHLRPDGTPSNPAACQELLRRAIWANNERAWEAMAPYWRTWLLRRIYAHRPEISPQAAERLVLPTLADFVSRLRRQPAAARHFPTYAELLTLLDDCLAHSLVTLTSS